MTSVASQLAITTTTALAELTATIYLVQIATNPLAKHSKLAKVGVVVATVTLAAWLATLGLRSVRFGAAYVVLKLLGYLFRQDIVCELRLVGILVRIKLL